MNSDAIKRYARHLVLKEIGGSGQQALLSSSVVIVGAGGLGGPAGMYLAAAGLGKITIIDDDNVELSNLQRQIQFAQEDLGQSKTMRLADRLQALNPDINIEHHNHRLDITNAKDLLSGHDIILDGTDSFETRFLINEISVALETPLVSGAIGRFNGQVGIFNGDKFAPCYQCLVPAMPPDVETCSDVGVVGALAGVVGSMMALETIKFIARAGKPLSGRLWVFDGLGGESRTVGLAKDPACSICG